jgi:FMN phosphatase YigB (HAD superfamily)
MEYKKIICFDFDDTLCHTPLPEDGKVIWKEKTGFEWPHRGWWSKPESLDVDVFDIPVNKWVYEKYLDAISEDSAYIILATGRIEPLRKEVEKVLIKNNLSFDDVFLNFGGDTFTFKTRLFENMIKKYQPEEFIMYDDREEHLPKFYEWAKQQPCKVTVVDVVKKLTKTFND